MQQNVGMADRYIRIAMGGFLLACSAAHGARDNQGTSLIAGLLGGMMLAEGVLGTCPLYTRLGINTRTGNAAEQVAQAMNGAMTVPHEGI